MVGDLKSPEVSKKKGCEPFFPGGFLPAMWELAVFISQELARNRVFMLEGYAGILKLQLCLSKIAKTGLLGRGPGGRLPGAAEGC